MDFEGKSLASTKKVGSKVVGSKVVARLSCNVVQKKEVVM